MYCLDYDINTTHCVELHSLNGFLDANVNKMKFQVIKYNAKKKFSYFTNNEYNTLSTTVLLKIEKENVYKVLKGGCL